MIRDMQKMLLPVWTLIAAAAGALAAGLAFAAWLDHGDEILFSLIQSGLAWCF